MNSRGWKISEMILQQVQVLAHPFIEMYRFHPHAFILAETGEPVLAHDQPVRTYLDGVLRIEPHIPLRTFAVDESPVRAAQVGNVIALAYPRDLGMERRDIGHIQDDVIFLGSPEGEFFLVTQLDNIWNFCRRLQGRQVGHAHHHAGDLAVHAKHVTVSQQTSFQDRPPLAGKGIGGTRQHLDLISIGSQCK